MDGPEEYVGTDPIPPACFAAFVANTWSTAAHVSLQYRGAALPLASFARIPVGAGPQLELAAYDPVRGILPGEVAVLFLSGRGEGTGDDEIGVPCPVPSAVPDAALDGTGTSDSFHITTDVPVVAYQIKPYGGGRAALTGASLLIPTSAWGTEYIAVEAGAQATGLPSMNVVARDDGTIVTITPTVAIDTGPGILAGAADQPISIELAAGQNLQITQPAERAASSLQTNRWASWPATSA